MEIPEKFKNRRTDEQYERKMLYIANPKMRRITHQLRSKRDAEGKPLHTRQQALAIAADLLQKQQKE